MPQNQNNQNSTAPQQSQKDFVNPNNFQETLESPVPEFQQPYESNTPKPEQHDISQHYDQVLQTTQKTASEQKANEILILCIYIIPVIAIFFLLLKPNEDKDFMWHVRHSLVAQGMWFAIILVLSFLSLPIISTFLLAIVKIAGYAILLYAGAMAYFHNKYKIPVVYDAGKKFIEGE